MMHSSNIALFLSHSYTSHLFDDTASYPQPGGRISCLSTLAVPADTRIVRHDVREGHIVAAIQSADAADTLVTGALIFDLVSQQSDLISSDTAGQCLFLSVRPQKNKSFCMSAVMISIIFFISCSLSLS